MDLVPFSFPRGESVYVLQRLFKKVLISLLKSSLFLSNRTCQTSPSQAKLSHRHRFPSNQQVKLAELGINGSFHEFFRMVNYSKRGVAYNQLQNHICGRGIFLFFSFAQPHIWRLMCLLLEKCLSALTLALLFSFGLIHKENSWHLHSGYCRRP